MRVPYTARDHYLTFKMLEIIQQHHFTKIWSFAIDRYPIGEGRKQKVDLARILLQDEPKFQDQFDFHWFNDRYASSLSKKLGTLERECKEGVLRPERLRVAVQICLDIALPQLHRDIRDGLALARPHTDKAAAQAAAARGVGSEADGLLDTVSFAPGTSTCVNAKASKTETAGGTPEPPRVGGPATGPKRARDDDIEEDGLSVKRARAQAPTETTASAPESSRLRATRWGRSPGRR
ncbi:MAG: hypothetical protein LQ345_001300 [Seirophora villosa]|nr:MAG: hypothetical protein LQ345_001300 [Seirophora villosa]